MVVFILLLLLPIILFLLLLLFFLLFFKPKKPLNDYEEDFLIMKFWKLFPPCFTAYSAPTTAALLEHLHGLGFAVSGHFRGDEQGWFRAEVVFPEADARVALDRFLASEEGIRHQLNTWAAWLESACPDQPRWLGHLIGSRQIFTLTCQDEDADSAMVQELCLSACRFLAQEAAGIYQIDGQGFFQADGSLIVRET